MRRTAFVAIALAVASSAASADPLPATPLTQDPLGPMVDVTLDWERYQPRKAFCVAPDVFQFPGPGAAASLDGTDPDCAASGFAPTDQGLVKIVTAGPPDECGTCTPPMPCAGCRRLFLDYSAIPANDLAAGRLYAHGHAYFHLSSFNPTLIVEPAAHSPNVKNFTNDELFVPPNAPYRPFVYGFDTHARAYTGNTAHFVHNAPQGPFYVGPWYVNGDGERIHGSYLDVMLEIVAPAPAGTLNEIGYGAGFHSGEQICFDEVVGVTLNQPQYRDGDGYYGGCIDAFGAGRTPLDPYGET